MANNYLPTTVFEEAIKRVEFIFDNCDDIIVDMSGGKDSTVVFNLALIVARQRNRLPLKVLWLDQEAEWQATDDYMSYVMHRKDVKPYWFQIPFDFTNSLSFEDNFLRVWDETKKDICHLQEVTYDKAVIFCKGEKNMIIKPEYKFYGLYHNGTMVSMLGMSEKNNKIKFHCNVTPEKYRKNGYFSTLLKLVIENKCKGKYLHADCLEASKNIYLNCGFSLKYVKHYKMFDIFKVERVIAK